MYVEKGRSVRKARPGVRSKLRELRHQSDEVTAGFRLDRPKESGEGGNRQGEGVYGGRGLFRNAPDTPPHNPAL